MKTIAYLRVSTDKQTMENQRNEINNYAVSNKLTIDEFIEIEISSRKSGKDRRITEITEKLKKNDRLIVSELSRLGRSTSEVLSIIDNFINEGITITFIKQNLTVSNDSQDLTSKVMITLFSLFAELERDLISKRTSEALQSRKKKGQILGRKKGSLSKSQYDVKANDILKLFISKVSASAIIRLIGFGSAKTLLEWKKQRIYHNPLLDELVFNDKFKKFQEEKK